MAKRRQKRPAARQGAQDRGGAAPSGRTAGRAANVSDQPAHTPKPSGSSAHSVRPVQPARPTRSPRGRAAPHRRGFLGGADPIRLGIIGAVVVAIGVLLVAVVFGGGGAGRYTCAQLLAPAGSADDGQVTANMGRAHVAAGSTLSYLFCPPTSGTHYNNEANVSPARAGFYGPDAAIGPGHWIHNLEHGYVVALYRCADGICPSEEVLAEIRRFVNNGPQTPVAASCGVRSKIVAARFDDMSTPFALLTWDRASLLETFDVDTALGFANGWMEKSGPEAASC